MRDLVRLVNLQMWYDIPDYNGYQIMFHSVSNDFKLVAATVRSFKNFKKYPYGYILPYYHYAKGKPYMDEYYIMTNYEGKRKRLTVQDICKIFTESDQIIIPAANGVRAGSRNRLIYKTDVRL